MLKIKTSVPISKLFSFRLFFYLLFLLYFNNSYSQLLPDETPEHWGFIISHPNENHHWSFSKFDFNNYLYYETNYIQKDSLLLNRDDLNTIYQSIFKGFQIFTMKNESSKFISIDKSQIEFTLYWGTKLITIGYADEYQLSLENKILLELIKSLQNKFNKT